MSSYSRAIYASILKINGISIEHRELALEVLQLLRSLVEDRYFNEVYTSVQSKLKFQENGGNK